MGSCEEDENLFSKNYDISSFSNYTVVSDVEMKLMQDGKVICAKRGGANFKTAVRVEPQYGLCQFPGFTPCANEMSRENIICYKTSEGPHSCPITDISFVEVGTEASEGEVVIQLSDDISIKYSKSFDSLPIISTRIETDGAPCWEDCEHNPKWSTVYSLPEYDFLRKNGISYRDAAKTLKNHPAIGVLNFAMLRVNAYPLECDTNDSTGRDAFFSAAN